MSILAVPSANAFGNFLLDKGYDVSSPVSLYRFVKGDGAGGVTPVTANTDSALGVAQFHVTGTEMLKGKGASVRVEGISEVYCSTTVALGQILTLNADGSVAPAVTGARVVGIARSDGITNGRCAIQLNLPGNIAP